MEDLCGTAQTPILRNGLLPYNVKFWDVWVLSSMLLRCLRRLMRSWLETYLSSGGNSDNSILTFCHETPHQMFCYPFIDRKGGCCCGSLQNLTSTNECVTVRLLHSDLGSGCSREPDISELLLPYCICHNATWGQQGGREWQQMVVGQCPRLVRGGNSRDMPLLHWSQSTCSSTLHIPTYVPQPSSTGWLSTRQHSGQCSVAEMSLE